jgi:hypothetical protein
MRITVCNDDSIIGWVREYCDGPNEHCRREARAGRCVHAIPRTLDPTKAVAWSTYHFENVADAIAALHAAVARHDGGW